MKRNGIHCSVRSMIFALLTREISSVSKKITSWFVLVCLVTQLCPTLWDPMDCSPSGSSVHGDSPGKNTGVGCHAPLQGIFPTEGLNPRIAGGFFTIWVTREAWFVLHLVSNLTWRGWSQRAFPEPKHIQHYQTGRKEDSWGLGPANFSISLLPGEGGTALWMLTAWDPCTGRVTGE